jgi:hypothetical protein
LAIIAASWRSMLLAVKAIARGPDRHLGQMRPDLGIEFGFTDGEKADGSLLTD